MVSFDLGGRPPLATSRSKEREGSNEKDSLVTCQAMVVKAGKGTEWVDMPKYSAMGWNPQIYMNEKASKEERSVSFESRELGGRERERNEPEAAQR